MAKVLTILTFGLMLLVAGCNPSGEGEKKAIESNEHGEIQSEFKETNTSESNTTLVSKKQILLTDEEGSAHRLSCNCHGDDPGCIALDFDFYPIENDDFGSRLEVSLAEELNDIEIAISNCTNQVITDGVCEKDVGETVFVKARDKNSSDGVECYVTMDDPGVFVNNYQN